MGGHVEQKLRLGVILAEYGERAVIRGAGLCRDALRHFLLHHDRNAVDRNMALKKSHDDRCGNIIRKICNDLDRLSTISFHRKFCDIQF